MFIKITGVHLYFLQYHQHHQGNNVVLMRAVLSVLVNRLTEEGGGPLVSEPHQSQCWATGVYCEAHYRALNSPCGTMRGLGPEAGPEAAQG